MTGRMLHIYHLVVLEDGIEIFCVHGSPSPGMVLGVLYHVVSNRDTENNIWDIKYEWLYRRTTIVQEFHVSSGEGIDGFLYDKPSGSGKHRKEAT